MAATSQEIAQGLVDNSRNELKAAFRAFGSVSEQLSGAFDALRCQVAQLRLELSEAHAGRDSLAARLSALIDGLPGGVLVLDARGDIQEANPAAIALLGSKGLTKNTLLIGDDGVPYEMCDITRGDLAAASSQPANLYAQGALTYALDSAKGMTLKVGGSAIGAPSLQNVSYKGDSNLGDPIVAPFVTKTTLHLTGKAIPGAPGSITTTPVTDANLWGNVYGAAHGGDCSGVAQP